MRVSTPVSIAAFALFSSQRLVAATARARHLVATSADGSQLPDQDTNDATSQMSKAELIAWITQNYANDASGSTSSSGALVKQTLLADESAATSKKTTAALSGDTSSSGELDFFSFMNQMNGKDGDKKASNSVESSDSGSFALDLTSDELQELKDLGLISGPSSGSKDPDDDFTNALASLNEGTAASADVTLEDAATTSAASTEDGEDPEDDALPVIPTSTIAPTEIEEPKCETGFWANTKSWWKNTFGSGDKCALDRRLRSNEET